MKKGDILIAIHPCIMSGNKRPTLTVGKEYVITEINKNELCIIDDERDPHWFNIRIGNTGYHKFFVLKSNCEIYY